MITVGLRTKIIVSHFLVRETWWSVRVRTLYRFESHVLIVYTFPIFTHTSVKYSRRELPEAQTCIYRRGSNSNSSYYDGE